MAPAATKNGPVDRLKAEAGGLLDALTDRAVSSVHDKVDSAAGRLTDYVAGNGGPGLIAALTGGKDMADGKGPVRSAIGAGVAGVKEKASGLFGGKGKSGGRQKLKLTNIVESIDVGVPVQLAYNQWTQFKDFPTFTKKVESTEQADDTRLNWKAQVFWSHRNWESTIIDQRPDERIIWRSKGPKGHVDGAVTFHELGPALTKIVVVLEYHPQGFFERTGNIWRAQGRRVRLELKHFQRHVTAHALLSPDEVEGWRGVIEDGEVVKDHETALEEEGREQDRAADEFADDEDTRRSADRDLADPDDERTDDADEEADRERPVRRRAPSGSGSRRRTPERARQGAARR